MFVLVDNVGVFCAKLLDLFSHHVLLFVHDHADSEVCQLSRLELLLRLRIRLPSVPEVLVPVSVRPEARLNILIFLYDL
jgi:hypothetical protein